MIMAAGTHGVAGNKRYRGLLIIASVAAALVLACLAQTGGSVELGHVPAAAGAINPNAPVALKSKHLTHLRLNKEKKQRSRLAVDFDEEIKPATPSSADVRDDINLNRLVHPNHAQDGLPHILTDNPSLDGTSLQRGGLAASPARHAVLEQASIAEDGQGGKHSRSRRAACPSSQVNVHAIDLAKHAFPADTISISIAWVGNPAKEMVALLEFSENLDQPNLYCSNNYGRNYTLCKNVDKPITQLKKETAQDGQVWLFALPSSYPSEYASKEDFDASKGFYLSKDNGNTFTFKRSDHRYDFILPNPANPAELLGFRADDDHAEYGVDDVYHVTHFASGILSSVRIIEHTYYAAWADLQAAGSSDDIIATVYRNEPGSGSEEEVEPLDLVRITAPSTPRQQVTILKKNCYDFEQQSKFMFATEVPSSDGFDERRLHVSTNEGTTFREAIFPFSARHNHFKVVDASEGVAFVLVQHTLTRVEGDTIFRINTPESIAGNYPTTKALFTPVIDGGELKGSVFVERQNPTGCAAGGGVGDRASGQIVLLERGDCPFTEKVANAEVAGAIAVVVANTDNDISFRMSSSDEGQILYTPAFMVQKSTADKIRNEIDNSGFEITVSLIEKDVKEQAVRRKSNVFISDESGVRYTLSLSDVVYLPFSQETFSEIADFHKVMAQPGTYIASQWLSNGITTLLTFNKGGSWQQMKAKHCETCVMTIALDSSYATLEIPLPYSTRTASGIILANGQSAATEPVSLYLSTDGGLTWNKVREKAHTYEILDHGGVIVALSDEVQSDSIFFTIDYGASWVSLPVSPQPHFLRATSESGGGTLVTYVYYYDQDQWIGTYIDFKPLFSGYCQFNTIGSSASDYELFSAGNTVGDLTCLMGRETKYLRRKACSRCYNGVDHEPEFEKRDEVETVTCPCSAYDFICSPGFSRTTTSTINEPCTYDAAESNEIQCTSDSPYVEARNYQRVVGNQCDGGQEADFQGTTKIACASHGDGKMVAIGFVVVVVLFVIFASVVLYRNPALRVRLREKLCSWKRPGKVGARMYNTSVRQDLIPSDSSDDDDVAPLFTIGDDKD